MLTRFAERLRPLSDAEWDDLGRDLDEHGLIDPIVCWREPGTGVLVVLDGHHRLRYCEANGIEIHTTTLDLPDEAAALEWIDQHQLGRRNLPEHVVAEMRGREYLRERQQGSRTDLTSGHGDQKSTAERIAAQHGVSEKTIRRNAQYAENLDEIAAKIDAELDTVRGHELTRTEAARLAQSPPTSAEELEARVEQMREQRTLRPPAASNDGEGWGQKSIVQTHTDTTPDGFEYVTGYTLSCGHEYETSRMNPPSGRKTARCRVCNPGTRAASDKRRRAKALDSLVRDALDDPARRRELVELAAITLTWLSWPENDARIGKLRERGEKAARKAGLLGEAVAA